MIRPAEEKDLPLLAVWMENLIQHTIQSTDDIYLKSLIETDCDQLQSLFRDILCSDKSMVLVADEANHSVGFVYGQLTDPVFQPTTIEQIGEIKMCWIDPEYRQQGIASQLVQEIEKWFKNKGVQFIGLHYFVGNVEAEQSWERLGYQPYRIAARKQI